MCLEQACWCGQAQYKYTLLLLLLTFVTRMSWSALWGADVLKSRGLFSVDCLICYCAWRKQIIQYLHICTLQLLNTLTFCQTFQWAMKTSVWSKIGALPWWRALLCECIEESFDCYFCCNAYWNVTLFSPVIPQNINLTELWCDLGIFDNQNLFTHTSGRRTIWFCWLAWTKVCVVMSVRLCVTCSCKEDNGHFSRFSRKKLKMDFCQQLFKWDISSFAWW